MRSLDDAPLGREERSVVEAALAADPALADELEAIGVALDIAVARTFWRELAGELPRHRRPAAAVLAALERTAA